MPELHRIKFVGYSALNNLKTFEPLCEIDPHFDHKVLILFDLFIYLGKFVVDFICVGEFLILVLTYIRESLFISIHDLVNILENLKFGLLHL